MKKLTFALAVFLLVTLAGSESIRAGGVQGGTSDLLQLLPDGGALVIVDAQKLTSTAVWNSPDTQKRVNGLIEKILSDVPDLGLNLSDVQTAVLTLPAGSIKNPTAAATGKFNRTDILSRIKASPKIKLSSTRYKEFEIYTATRTTETGTKTGEVSFVFYDEQTVVLGSMSNVQASVDTKLGGRASIAKNTKLGSLVSQNPSAAIRFAIEVTPAMASALNSSQLPLPDFSSVNLVFGSIDVNSTLELNATLRNDTPAHAKAIADRLNGVLGMARSYLGASGDSKNAAIVAALKTISITPSDMDVRITGSLPLSILGQAIQ